jgi:predicted ATP-grasp superfamily ATP-dependent carboligase
LSDRSPASRAGSASVGSAAAHPLHILVLDGGAQFTPAIMRSLRRRHAHVSLGVCGSAASPAARSRYCNDVVQLPPLEQAGAAMDCLRAEVRSRGIDVVLPTVDEAVLALRSYRAELEAFVPVAMPPESCLAKAVDKSVTVTSTCLIDNGFAVPKTITPETPEEAVETWTGRFPVVVKPRVGTGSEGIRFARNANELRRVFALVQEHYPRPLVQEHIEYAQGEKFVLLYLFDHQGRLCSWYGQRVLLERRSLRLGIEAGRTRGGVSLLWRSHRDDNLLERGRAMLEALGWSGLAAVECARDRRDGRHYLFEINARLDGTSTLALRYGPNFAYDSCLVALRQVPPAALDFVAGRGGCKGPFTMLDARELRSALGILDPRFAPPVPALADPGPLLAEAARLMAKRLPRR